MLLSQVVLLFFMGTWLKSQHSDERERLYKDLNAELIAAQDDIIDSVIHTRLAQSMDGEGITGTMVADSLIEMHAPATFDSLFIPSPDSFRVVNTGFKKQIFPVGKNHTIDLQIMERQDSVSTIAIKGVRMLIRDISSIGPNHNRLFGMDSAVLMTRFRKRLAENGYPFGLRWAPTGTDDRNRNQFMVLSAAHIAASSDLVVAGIQLYLLRSILPQIAFSLVLLLLTGLAFGLSYANLRRQIRLGLQKDDFISNMSHELKTPVATAKVALEALRNYNALNDPQRTQDYLQMASWEIDRLDVLIARVLNTVQLENGQIVLRKEHFDLLLMVRELVQAMQPRAAGRNATIFITAGAEHLPVFADRLHLQGAVYNLLDNALKYGGNKISIALEKAAGLVSVVVADNGSGIPQEYSRKIFEKFFRVPKGDVHDVKGYGLGLNYTRYIMEAHGGGVRQHNGEDGGAVFTIYLPENAEA